MNKSYVILCIMFGFGLGIGNSIMQLIDQIVHPIGYDSNQAGVLGSVMLGSGLVGSIIIGIILSITHAYKTCLKVTVGIGTLFMFVMVYLLRPNKYHQLLAFFSITGERPRIILIFVFLLK